MNEHYDIGAALVSPAPRKAHGLPAAYRSRTRTMDMPPAVPTAPVAARRSGPRRVAIVAALTLGVMIIRPWDGVAGSAPASAPRVPDAGDRAAQVVAVGSPSPSP